LRGLCCPSTPALLSLIHVKESKQRKACPDKIFGDFVKLSQMDAAQCPKSLSRHRDSLLRSSESAQLSS